MSTRFRNVVVPIDGTRSSERALALAKTLAGSADGELIMLRVDESEAFAHSVSGPPVGVLARARSAWAEIATRRRRQEDIARTIASAALRHDADLIAMSTHARSTLGHWLLGSVDDHLVRTADVPVLLVPPRAQVDQSDAALRHAVVALDGSLHAEAALRPARALARQYGTRLTLVRVVGPWDKVVGGDRRARDYLDLLADELRASGISVVIHTRYGEPAAELASSAGDHNADLIVMATRARQGIERLALGSVYAATLRRARVPLLVLRSTRLVRARQEAPLWIEPRRLMSAA
jgi:nucleotide-binding universal stress UspA family protein